jgi:uncharacterized YigZ family protein
MSKSIQEQDFYFTIAQTSLAEFKDRGSKFIAFVYPVATVEEVKSHLLLLKKEHPKAIHHCYAYRIGLYGNNFRVSDDGEPSGSAGKPILNQIDSKQITNVLVIVVRYFGGTLLGIPGLINAYKTTTALALQLVPVIQKSVEINYELHFDYTKMNEVMTLVKQYNCSVIEQQTQLFCLLKIGIPKARLQDMLFKLNDMHTITVQKI